MALEMDDDLEFLLPSELLTDDDLLFDFGSGFGNSSGLSSDPSSPVESVTGFTETGSDEDDFVSELTQKLTHSTLRDSGFSYGYATKGVKLSGSPQSTLCGYKLGSRGSPNSDSRVSSPPELKMLRAGIYATLLRRKLRGCVWSRKRQRFIHRNQSARAINQAQSPCCSSPVAEPQLFAMATPPQSPPPLQMLKKWSRD